MIKMDSSSYVSLIIPFQDSTFLAYTRGQFDNWRVTFMTKEGKAMESPRDTYFFDYYLSLATPQVSTKKIFNALKHLSRHIRKDSPTEFEYLREEVVSVANQLLIPSEHHLRFEKATMSLLAAMLSEEKKKFTKLGKKLKILGLYQVLVQGMAPEKAANWSRGKAWKDILKEYNNTVGA